MVSIRHLLDCIQKDSQMVSYYQEGGIVMAVIKTQFTLRLNPTDHAKIKKIAEMENRSMTNMIETLVIHICHWSASGKAEPGL